MAKPVAVAVADTHLQVRAWQHRPIFGDSYYSFRQVIDYAVTQELPVLGAGDLLDSRVNMSEPILFLNEQLKRLEEAGLLMYFTQGQHELQVAPWFSVSPAAVHIHKKLISLGDLNIYGLDYQPTDKLLVELDLIPKDADVACLHQVWIEFMHEYGGQISFADVPQVKTIFTGDYHVTDINKKAVGRDGQKMRVHSLGSTCLQDISEEPVKCFGILYDNGIMEQVSLKTRHVWKPDTILNEGDLQECLQELPTFLGTSEAATSADDYPEEIRKPIIRIEYSTDMPDIENRIMGLVESRAHVFWKPLLVKPKDEPEEERNPDMASLRTALPHIAMSKDAHTLSARLLNVPPDAVKDELQNWFDEQKATVTDEQHI